MKSFCLKGEEDDRRHNKIKVTHLGGGDAWSEGIGMPAPNLQVK